MRLLLELPLHVDRAGRDERVDTWLFRVAQRFGRNFEVLGDRARQCRDDRLLQFATDGLNRVELRRTGNGEARFDHVDTEPLQLTTDIDLLSHTERCAGGLLAVAQSRIEDFYY